MKKILLICSLLCLLTAATSMAVFGASDDAKEDSKTTTAQQPTDNYTASPETPDIPSEDTADNSLTRISLFGNPIGIYRLDWAFELRRVTTDQDGSENITDSSSGPTNSSDYIDNGVSDEIDRSLKLNLSLPIGDTGEALQLIVGLDVQQARPLPKEEADKPPVTETTTAVTTTVTPTTQTPTTQIPTTQKPATTQKPVTQAPTTTQKPIVELGAIPTTVAPMEYTEEEYQLLARIIYCEAGGEEIDGMLAVGTVVLNRVQSPLFPNNIHDVIFQKGQFTPAGSGKVNRVTPNKESYEAARRVLEGERSDLRILYFRLSKYASEPWMNGKRTLIFTIDKQSFYS